jgi:hypothetical protein
MHAAQFITHSYAIILSKTLFSHPCTAVVRLPLTSKAILHLSQERGVNVTANSVHPGIVHSNFLQDTSIPFICKAPRSFENIASQMRSAAVCRILLRAM